MSDDEINDPIPALKAEIDQMMAMAPEIARTVKGYYASFLAEDFSEAQALWLAVAQLKDTLGSPPDG